MFCQKKDQRFFNFLFTLEKSKSKPLMSNIQPVTRKVIPKAKTAVPISKPKGLQKSLGPKKAVKPKPVLGSKLRRNSSSLVTKSCQSPISSQYS